MSNPSTILDDPFTPTYLRPLPPTLHIPRMVAWTAVVIVAFLLIINTVLVALMAWGTGDVSNGMTSVDQACVNVLRNGGVPEDCSRMYRLDFYP